MWPNQPMRRRKPGERGSERGPIRIVSTVSLAMLFAGWAGCAGEGTPGSRADSGGEEIGSAAPGALKAESSGGMVVSGNPLASRAGVEMLRSGGNAADAAVAAAFALAVVEPSQSGLGGRTQALVRLPDGRFHGIDGTTQLPLGFDASAAPQVERGYATVAIPGTVRALTRLHAEYGSLPLKRVLEPAIRHAREGFPLTEGEARRISGVVEELRALPGSAARYFLKPDGSTYAGGDVLVQGDLGRVLETLAEEGPGAFYAGEIARRMVEDIQGNGGYLTLEDLAGYRATDAVLAFGSYRGLELVGTYLPASGATVIEILHIMENFPMEAMTEAERASIRAQALLLGFLDREDLQFHPPVEAVARLTSKPRAAELAGTIRAARSGSSAGLPEEAVEPREWPHTSHLSVADSLGMVVAMTQSLGPTLGSGVVTPGLGFVYAATMGGYLADTPPGGRPWSSQAPLILLDRGAPRYVLGGAGARRIVSGLVAVVSRLVDEGLGMEEALVAPRLHPAGGTVTLEAFGQGQDASPVDSVRRRLSGLGFEVETRPSSSWFGLLNAVQIGWEPEGEGVGFLGVADPRWRWGSALGPHGEPRDLPGGS